MYIFCFWIKKYNFQLLINKFSRLFFKFNIFTFSFFLHLISVKKFDKLFLLTSYFWGRWRRTRRSHLIPITNTIKIKWRANVVDIAIFITISQTRFDKCCCINIVNSKLEWYHKKTSLWPQTEQHINIRVSVFITGFVQKQKLHSDLSMSTIKSNGYRWLTCGYNNTIKWLSFLILVSCNWQEVGSKNVKRRAKIDINGDLKMDMNAVVS